MIRYYHHGMLVPEEVMDKEVEEQISGLSINRNQVATSGCAENQNFNVSDVKVRRRRF